MNWRRFELLVDERIRDELRLPEHRDRERAATVSDFILTGAIVDAALTRAVLAPLAKNDASMARRATAAHALAIGITLLLGSVIKAAVKRPRPFVRDCVAHPSLPGCGVFQSNASFYSLHAATAFTCAGFSYAMGSSPTACGASLAMAGATGLLRIVSDRHYLSDVLIGAAMGFVVGYVVPVALLPRPLARPPEDPQRPRTVPIKNRKVVIESPASIVSVPTPAVIMKA